MKTNIHFFFFFSLILTTGWTVRGSNPGGGEIFRTRPHQPWDHPASNTMSNYSFPGVKRPGPGVDPHPI
jgi:hypothetical protein